VIPVIDEGKDEKPAFPLDGTASSARRNPLDCCHCSGLPRELSTNPKEAMKPLRQSVSRRGNVRVAGTKADDPGSSFRKLVNARRCCHKEVAPQANLFRIFREEVGRGRCLGRADQRAAGSNGAWSSLV